MTGAIVMQQARRDASCRGSMPTATRKKSSQCNGKGNKERKASVWGRGSKNE